MLDAGPAIGLMAIGLVLWLAVTATIGGISIQTIGIILFLVGLVWLVIQLFQSRDVGRRTVATEPVARDRVVREREVL